MMTSVMGLLDEWNCATSYLERVKICGFETDNALYEAVTQVCANESHVCRSEEAVVWPQRLGHVSSAVI